MKAKRIMAWFLAVMLCINAGEMTTYGYQLQNEFDWNYEWSEDWVPKDGTWLDEEEVASPSEATKSDADSRKLLKKASDGNVVHFEVTKNYDGAKQMLELLNKDRKAEGLPPLTMDTELMEAAMQRAAEVSIKYAHDRPNGSSFSSVLPSRLHSENITSEPGKDYGAKEAEQKLMNSPRHRENILRSRWNGVGIGCIEVGGVTVWVQCFSTTKKAAANTSGKKDTVMAVDFGDNIPDITLIYNGMVGSDMILEPGAEGELAGSLSKHYGSVRLAGDNFLWYVEDESIATIHDNQFIRGNAPGSTYVTAALKSNPETTYTRELQVKKVVHTIEAKEAEIWVQDGESSRLDIIADPENAAYTVTSWKIKDKIGDISVLMEPYVEPFADIYVTGIGQVTVSAEVIYIGGSKTIEFIVHSYSNTPENLQLQKEYHIKVGQKLRLESPLLAGDSTCDIILMENPSVVKQLDGSGNIQGQKPGMTTIKIKENKKSPAITELHYVVVTEDINHDYDIKVESIQTNYSSCEMKTGESVQLTAEVYPGNATVKNLSYESSDTSIIDVSQTGRVIAKKAGTATVAVKATDGSGVQAVCSFSIKDKDNGGGGSGSGNSGGGSGGSSGGGSGGSSGGGGGRTSGGNSAGPMKLADTYPGAIWVKEADGSWILRKADGSDVTGWAAKSGAWYYLNSQNHKMQTGWLQDADGKWYYLQQNGVMLANAVTPDGYKVDASGVCQQLQ